MVLAQCHHVHIVSVALLELVLPSVDQTDCDVLVEIYDDEAEEPADC